MGEVVHKQPQHGTEVVLRPGHGDLYGDGRLGVTVATRRGNNTYREEVLQTSLTARFHLST